MIRFVRGLLVSGLAALALAACSSDMSSQQSAAMAGAEQPKLSFTVSAIDIASNFHADDQPPHVEALLPVSLEQRVAEWGRTHLAARGGSLSARFVVTDASLVRTNLGEDVGAPGLMRAAQTIRYDATVAATFEVLDRYGERKAYATGKVSLGRTMAAFESDAARDVLLRDLAEAVMKKFDAEMERVLKANVARYMI